MSISACTSGALARLRPDGYRPSLSVRVDQASRASAHASTSTTLSQAAKPAKLRTDYWR